jgi:hypothetical protein
MFSFAPLRGSLFLPGTQKPAAKVMHLLVYKVIMPAMSNDTSFETLDPEDWGKMRSLAHKMVDDAVDYLETVGDKPVWQQVPEAVKQTFT